MAISQWSPLKDLVSLHDRMNRLFEDVLGHPLQEGLGPATWTPPVDIYETETSIILKAELPGVRLEHIDLQVTDNTLILRGERRLEKNVKEEHYHRIERVYGAFYRAFTLPTAVRRDQIKASLRDGILEVVVPKAEDATPKQIKVEVA
jgi:HSP20 family protein